MCNRQDMCSDRNVYRLLFVLFIGCLLFLIIFKFKGREIILEGDAFGYYAQVVSFVIDHDFFWMDRIQYFNPQPHFYHSVPVGTAILWAPFFGLFHICAIFFNKLGLPISTSVYSTFHQASAYFANLVYSFLAILLTYKTLCLFYSRRVSIMSSLAVIGGTSVLNTTIWQTTMNHAPSYFIVTIFVYYWLQQRDKPTCKSLIILGFAGGLMCMVRWQNALFMVLPFFDALRDQLRAARKLDLKDFSAATLKHGLFLPAVLIGFSPQNIYWKTIHDKYFVYYYAHSNFLSIKLPDWRPILFSTNHGLITWTPMVGIALIGLLAGFKKKSVHILLFMAFLLQLHLNSSVIYYGTGIHFGLRQFANCTTIFALGIAELLSTMKKASLQRAFIAVLLFLVVWNMLFLYQYEHNFIPLTGHLTMRQLVWDKLLMFFVEPGELIANIAREHKFLISPNIYDAKVFRRIAGEPDYIVDLSYDISRAFPRLLSSKPYILIYRTGDGFASYLFEDDIMAGIFRPYEDICFCDDHFPDLKCKQLWRFIDCGATFEEVRAFLNISTDEQVIIDLQKQ